MSTTPVRIGVACGGTGGHLYPGLAVAGRLAERGVSATLWVSAKPVDQEAVRHERRYGVETLPAIGWSWRRAPGFFQGLVGGWRQARRVLAQSGTRAVVSMGGFTGAPVVLAARSLGIPVVLHEANAIPGRANRWLGWMATGGLVHFEGARRRWRMARVAQVGMPVREGFEEGGDREACCAMMGLAGNRPVLLAMGGSQGARALNTRMLEVAPALAERVPGLQFLHLTGRSDEGRVREGYQAAGLTAVVRPFVTEMEVALAAADAVVGRAGASSVAEFGAMRLPALLIPLPTAADDHQRENARELERAGAARWLDAEKASKGEWIHELTSLLTDVRLRERLREGWRAWHRPGADIAVAGAVLEVAGLGQGAADGGWAAGVWAT